MSDVDLVMDSGLVWAGVTKVPQTERPEQQTFIVSHSGLWESKVKVWAGLISSLLGCDGSLLMVFPLPVCVFITSSHKDTSHIGLETHSNDFI